MATKLQWVTNPDKLFGPPAGRVFTPEIIEALMENPGKWALIKKAHGNSATLYGYARRHPEFEVKAKANNGGWDLYMRFVGDVD